MKTNVKKTLVAYSFITPSLLGLLCFTLLPIVISLIASFSDWMFIKGIQGLTFIGLENYRKLFSDRVFWKSITNNLILLTGIPVSMFIALIFAVVVEKYIYGRKLLRLFIYIPNLTSGVVIAYIWKLMLSGKGTINSLLTSIFQTEMPVWFFDQNWSLPVLVLVGIWSTTGYCFIIYSASLQNIPKEIYEAAEMEGCTWIQGFFHITIPYIASTSFFLIITQIIFSFRVFAPVYILTQGGPGISTTVSAYQIYKTAFQYYDMGYAAAMTWIVFIILFIFTLFKWQGQKRKDF